MTHENATIKTAYMLLQYAGLRIRMRNSPLAVKQKLCKLAVYEMQETQTIVYRSGTPYIASFGGVDAFLDTNDVCSRDERKTLVQAIWGMTTLYCDVCKCENDVQIGHLIPGSWGGVLRIEMRKNDVWVRVHHTVIRKMVARGESVNGLFRIVNAIPECDVCNRRKGDTIEEDLETWLESVKIDTDIEV